MLIPAVKGIFLIGVLSWYSAALFAMINNYFRNEFQDYLKKNPIDTIPINDRSKALTSSSSTTATTTTPASIANLPTAVRFIDEESLNVKNEDNFINERSSINACFWHDSSDILRYFESNEMRKTNFRINKFQCRWKNTVSPGLR